MIKGVIKTKVPQHQDHRGILFELFRTDEIPVNPAQGYFSLTKPGITRGPHEHIYQTDVFVFLDGNYEVYLWGKSESGESIFETLYVGLNNPMMVVVPPGVIHAYKNTGINSAFVLNFPNQLYKGVGKNQEVDEIRHEENPNSPYQLT